VELNDTNKMLSMIWGEFRDRGLNNLDLYLVSAESNAPINSTCSSISEVDSVEHIFCPVPTTGKYKIRVQFRQPMNKATQTYALPGGLYRLVVFSSPRLNFSRSGS